MLLVVSALKGYAIEASDGRIGTVSDFLFDDETWKVRWLVVDTGTWLSSRKVLVHPSAIAKADYERQQLAVALTRVQIERSPDIRQDQPVSRQMEYNLYDYYGWDPLWGGASYFGGGAIASPLGSPPFFGRAPAHEAELLRHRPENEDPHLRSASEIKGYHIHATDGGIGHVENLLIDDVTWSIRYLIIDTRDWWPGKHVLVSPYAAREVSWSHHRIRLDISRDQVKGSPPWDPVDIVDQVYEKRLHTYYGWPGYGW